MIEQPFTPYQLFHLKRSTLEEQILHFYQETQDSSTTIQLLLAMKIRYMLGEADFELFLQDLVKYLFANQRMTRDMQRYVYFFREYFEESEWKVLSARWVPSSPVPTDFMNVPSTVPVTEANLLKKGENTYVKTSRRI